jgi:hypothetical protein
MADAMPARVFNHWRHYYLIEPFGQWRDNYHAGLVSAILANVNRSSKSDPVSHNDFMFMDPETAAEHEEEKAAAAMRQFMGGLEAKAEGQKREKALQAAKNDRAKSKGKSGKRGKA